MKLNEMTLEEFGSSKEKFRCKSYCRLNSHTSWTIKRQSSGSGRLRMLCDAPLPFVYQSLRGGRKHSDNSKKHFETNKNERKSIRKNAYWLRSQ